MLRGSRANNNINFTTAACLFEALPYQWRSDGWTFFSTAQGANLTVSKVTISFYKEDCYLTALCHTGLISWDMIANEECSILISRYADFFSLVLNVVNADNWRVFTLQDLFLSVDSMVR